MKPKHVVVLAVASAVVVLLASAAGFVSSSAAAPGSRSATAPTMNIGMTGTMTNMDPARTVSGVVYTMAYVGLEGLTTVDNNGKVKPWLARSVSTPNPFTYIYHLRHGVKFWDGNELTATDVANSLNYYRFKQFPISNQLGYPSVRSIVAKDKYTVVVTLKRRDNSWQYTPANYGWIFEKKFQDEHGSSMGDPRVMMMGTGPWKYDSFDPVRGIEMSANPNYWGGKVSIQHLSFKFIQDTTTLALAYKSGAIDYFGQINDPAGWQAVAGSPPTKLNTNGGCTLLYFAMNTQAPGWNDVHVRRAAAYALNRPEIIAAGSNTLTSIPTYWVIHPNSLASVAPSPSAEAKALKASALPGYNLAKAKAEMAKSKFPNGFTSFSWMHNSGNGTFLRTVQAISDDLSKIGIKLDVRQSPSVAAWISYISGPHADIPTLFTGTSCTSPDPGFLPQSIVSSANAVDGKPNRASYVSTKADSLIEQGRHLVDPTKRFDIYSRLLKVLQQDVPYVPVYTNRHQSYIALNSKFTIPKPLNYQLSAWPLMFKPAG